jgi:3-deoxy-D-manno-octulosonic-acid transferase
MNLIAKTIKYIETNDVKVDNIDHIKEFLENCDKNMYVSIRDYQSGKVDIVHKYNAEQCKILIINKEISDTLINAYNRVNIFTINSLNDANIIFDDAQEEENKKKKEDYNNNIYVFNSEDEDDESI